MRKRPEPTPSTAERVTLIVSFLVVALLIAVALFEEARIEESKPGTLDVVFRTERTTLRNGDYYVPYTVFNHGAAAVDAAQIRLEVYSDAGVVESDDITVQFLPLDGNQTGIFVTAHDPTTHSLRARLVTVQFP